MSSSGPNSLALSQMGFTICYAGIIQIFPYLISMSEFRVAPKDLTIDII